MSYVYLKGQEVDEWHILKSANPQKIHIMVIISIKKGFQLFEDMTITIIFFENKPPLNEAQISTEMY